MKLFDALQWTGKAVKNSDVQTLIEHLAEEDYLVVTRRGISIIGHRTMSRRSIEEEIASPYGDLAGRDWYPARLVILSGDFPSQMVDSEPKP